MKITLACMTTGDIDALRVLRLEGSATAVLRSAECTDEQATSIASLWNSLPDGEQARCHSPGFALQALVEEAPVFTANICWDCNNVSIDGPAASISWRSFEARSRQAQTLLALCSQVARIPGAFERTDFKLIKGLPGESLDERNAFYRKARLLQGPSTDGVPDDFGSTVRLLRSAFPRGIEPASADFHALLAFLDDEGWPRRAMAHALDFAFDVGYVTAMNTQLQFPDADARKSEATRIECLLAPEDLQRWRRELE